MGCDIHLHLEVVDKPIKQNPYWNRVAEFDSSRNYWMFEIMAGVRGENALFKPKGLPKDANMMTMHDNQLYVSENYTGGEGMCSRENAEEWVKRGSSYYLNGDQTIVSNPDRHSHSWLSTLEFSDCLQEYKKRHKDERIPVDYEAIKAMMDYYEYHGKTARIVFSFDN